MTWYHAADGKQAGPFSAEQFRELIANGTIQPPTLVWEARLPNWIPLSQVPPEMLPAPAMTPGTTPPVSGVVCAECQQSFPPDQVIRIADRFICGNCKPILVQRLSEGAVPAAVPGAWVNEQQLLEREFRIDIGGCLERGWKAISNNLGPVILSSLLYVLMLLGIIGIIGGVFALGFSVTGFGPGGGGGSPSAMAIAGLVIGIILGVIVLIIVGTIVVAGYSWFYLNLVRHGEANYGQIFEGFRRQFWTLLGAWFIQTLISVGISVPFTIINQVIVSAQAPTAVVLLSSGLFQLISMAISIYLWAIWLFTTLLILDKRMRFWPAMQLSRKMVSKRFWMALLFLLVAGILGGVGAFACGIGLLVSVPLYLTMKAVLYEDNFRDFQPAQT